MLFDRLVYNKTLFMSHYILFTKLDREIDMDNSDQDSVKKSNRVSIILPSIILSYLIILLMLFIIRYPNKTQLIGFTPKAYPVNIDLKNMYNGTSQIGINQWVNDNFTGHNFIVKCYNQFKYTFLHEGTNGWLLGKEGYIFNSERSYGYVSGVKANINSQDENDEYAMKLRSMQDKLESQGKEFLLYLNPIKDELYTDKLPDSYNFVAEKYLTDENNPKQKLISSLEKFGIHYYDTTNDWKNLKKSGQTVFHNTGIHPTIDVTTISLNIALQSLNNSVNPKISIIGSKNLLFAVDKDIFSLQNVFRGIEGEEYNTPVINYEFRSPQNVFIFGTSYGWELVEALYRNEGNHAFNQLCFQEYFTNKAVMDDNGRQSYSYTQNQPIADIGTMEEIRNSNLVIMEQQYAYGIIDTHKKFIDYVNENADNLYYSPDKDIIDYTLDSAAVKYNNFFSKEDWGIWGKGLRSSVTLYSNNRKWNEDCKLNISAKSNLEDHICSVYINNAYIGELELNTQSQNFILNIPKNSLASDVNKIEFYMDGTLQSPFEAGNSDDTRSLGIGINSLILQEGN